MGTMIKYSRRRRAVTALRILFTCSMALTVTRAACAELPKFIESARNPNSELQRTEAPLDLAQSDTAPRSQREAAARSRVALGQVQRGLSALQLGIRISRRLNEFRQLRASSTRDRQCHRASE